MTQGSKYWPLTIAEGESVSDPMSQNESAPNSLHTERGHKTVSFQLGVQELHAIAELGVLTSTQSYSVYWLYKRELNMLH